MWWKNPKLWGTIATILFTIVMLATGIDIKKYVCESAPVANVSDSQ